MTGPGEVVFDWSADRCADDDIPDLPARALRDASGLVHLYASYVTTRRMTGPDLASVRRDCSVVMRSHGNPDPAAFDDQEWLASTYTFDGKTVYGLVHDELQGYRRPALCASREYLKCWYNGLTLATSRDGGATFDHLPAPRHLVAALPTRYEPDGGPAGVFTPSSMVRNSKNRYIYALVRQIERYDRDAGTCVMRTRTPGRPSSWRAWDGSGFNARFINPYRDEEPRPTPARRVLGA